MFVLVGEREREREKIVRVNPVTWFVFASVIHFGVNLRCGSLCLGR